MNQQRKLAALTLLLLLVGTCIMMANVASAQSITKPSVPNFTVTYVDSSYYMEPVYGVDQYSGKTIQTGGGYTVQNKSFELKIKNLPFTPYTVKDADGADRQVVISYEIRYKGHYGQDWKYYNAIDNPSLDYTVVLFGLDWGSFEPPVQLDSLQAGDQMDFEVQTRIGYFSYNGVNPLYGMEFVGEVSGWSNTQTATVPDNYISPSVPEFQSTIIVPLLGVFSIVAIALVQKKKVQT